MDLEQLDKLRIEFGDLVAVLPKKDDTEKHDRAPPGALVRPNVQVRSVRRSEGPLRPGKEVPR
ncbi:MAG: hypothetical protein MZU95_16685 [Desulfomicrobium escambiense]|nr:hypothetical protein [Desulfomicrobium escambiense]